MVMYMHIKKIRKEELYEGVAADKKGRGQHKRKTKNVLRTCPQSCVYI